ncbi:exported hypothetical protein [Mesorhizobium plurifarium]|uniref:Serine protease n=1 Tax=Mesorhizobium plurifarium TaxID=69974 RepID=A0A090G7X7_MESPL|nr:exported hypothetical protein [Mesorhizobium plurifarium]
MRKLLAVVICAYPPPAFAVSPAQIVSENTRAIVYLQAEDANGGVVERGTGFIVSHDGYIVTAAHVFPPNAANLWAVIGQREGTRYSLTLRERNEGSDVALWQLPQSASCRYSVTIAEKNPKVLDRTLALGFPGKEGLTPVTVNITNLTSALGFYKTDGFLEPGNSGGPVFNEDGMVVAFVEGGTVVGSDNNDIVPIAAAIDLIRKRGVQAGIGKPVPFDISCYASCRTPENGVESWGREEKWGPVNSGWLPGGHDQTSECKKLIAADQVPGSEIKLNDGSGLRCNESPPDVGMCEDVKNGPTVQYRYQCQGIFRSQPIYFDKQSPACGLWN